MSHIDGVAISGGEPLMHPDRVVQAISHFKSTRGSTFHIHLYTNGTLLNQELIDRLGNAGLDELRVNSLSPKTFRKLAQVPFDVICEVPCIPDESYLHRLSVLMAALPSFNVHKVNLNELEVTRENYQAFSRRGYQIHESRVQSSRAAAELLVERSSQIEGLSVFFCSFEIAERIRIARNRLSIQEVPRHGC
jgi:pyruvate formate-lyase activating enzyme-like uncharacterized protein